MSKSALITSVQCASSIREGRGETRPDAPREQICRSKLDNGGLWGAGLESAWLPAEARSPTSPRQQPAGRRCRYRDGTCLLTVTHGSARLSRYLLSDSRF